VHRLVNGGPLDGQSAGKLLWALASVGAATLGREPQAGGPAERWQLRMTRRHLQARQLRLQAATHYDVLEVTPNASSGQIDYAARVLATRFAPERTRKLDLADLAPFAHSNWQQILLARKTLMDHVDRANYNDAIGARRAQLRSPWTFEAQEAKADAEFRRGQASLVAGDVFKAVSAFASACRAHPEHPVYEASLCWARYRAEMTRGKQREEIVGKERQAAENALWGRRPFPQALVALALLCAADGDAESARWHLQEALAINPNLPAARQLWARLAGAR
jgi:hypothetical protein